MTCTKTYMMSSVFVIYVITLTAALQTNSCLPECMKEVLKCKRLQDLGFMHVMECCDNYTMCYFLCQPDAITTPLCQRTNKRGSWNKRQTMQDNQSSRGLFYNEISQDDDLNED